MTKPQSNDWQEWREVERHIKSGVRVLDIANDYIDRGRLIELEISFLQGFKNKKEFFALMFNKIKTYKERLILRRRISKTQRNYIKPTKLIEKIITGGMESQKARVNWLAYLYDHFVSCGYSWTFEQFLQLRWDSLEEFRLASDVRKSREASYLIDIANMSEDGVQRLNTYARRLVPLTRQQRIDDIQAQFNTLRQAH